MTMKNAPKNTSQFSNRGLEIRGSSNRRRRMRRRTKRVCAQGERVDAGQTRGWSEQLQPDECPPKVTRKRWRLGVVEGHPTAADPAISHWQTLTGFGSRIMKALGAGWCRRRKFVCNALATCSWRLADRLRGAVAVETDGVPGEATSWQPIIDLNEDEGIVKDNNGTRLTLSCESTASWTAVQFRDFSQRWCRGTIANRCSSCDRGHNKNKHFGWCVHMWHGATCIGKGENWRTVINASKSRGDFNETRKSQKLVTYKNSLQLFGMQN